MSKPICARQKYIICNFTQCSDCKEKNCKGCNLPKGSGLYLFDRINPNKKGIYELWLSQYYQMNIISGQAEPAKVDYIFFYPSHKLILLIEITNVFGNSKLIEGEVKQIRRDVWKLLENENISREKCQRVEKVIKEYFNSNKYFNISSLKDFLKIKLPEVLKNIFNEEKVNNFINNLIDDICNRLPLKIKNELLNKIDGTLRIFELYFDKIGRKHKFEDFLTKFKIKPVLLVWNKELIFSFAKKSIHINRLQSSVLILDCKEICYFFRSLIKK